jgi:hypothetical protein
LPLESGKCDSSSHPFTSKATPAAIGDQTEQHNLPTESKNNGQGKCENDSDWPESKEDKLIGKSSGSIA